MRKRLMTLTDLYAYFASQNVNQTFSCKGNEENEIVVQVNGTMKFSKEDATEGMYPARVQMNFVGDNLNGSRIEMKAQKNALSSSKFRPLLAYIHEVDGEPQFYGHNMHKDDEGNIVYDEVPVGVIIEEAHIEHDDEYDKDYAVANAYIWEAYSRAPEILERDEKCDCSVELCIREMSYDAKSKVLNLDNFYYSGCTMLGMDDDGEKIDPAMPGSNVTLKDFSIKNADYSNEKVIESLDEIKQILSNFNIQNLKEGGKQVKFEELLEKYGKTADDVIFNYENMSDEELEVAFAEAFAEDEGDEGNTAEEAPASENPDADPEPTEDENAEEGDDSTETESVDNPESEPEAEDEFALKFTVSGKDISKDFSISLNDKLYAMWSLVNETYGELDNDYYEVDVYEEDKIVEMHSWFGKHYRQSFKTKKDAYQLVGDRVEIFAKYLTQDEITALDNMKANYSALEEIVGKYEAEPKKLELINSKDYEQIAEVKEFMELKKKDVYFDMSIEELAEKADAILLQYAKNNKLEFSAQPEKKQFGLQHTITGKKKTSRYGNLFSKE